ALIDVGFIRYNAGHPGAKIDVFPHLSGDRSVPLFNFKSCSGYVRPERLDALGIAADNWRPHPTDHYRYALSRPELDGVLCAPQRTEHVSELVSALESGPLSLEQ